jgi:hypothetical protein
MFTEPFPSNGRLFLLIKNLLPSNGRQLYSIFYRRTTRHIITRVAKYIDVDSEIFEKVLY